MPSSPSPARPPSDEAPCRPDGPGPRIWLRPAAFLLGGLALALVLLWLDRVAGAVMLTLLALLMGYWTSPLRRGDHTPLRPALDDREPDTAVILWAPGDPLSARLQTAIRGRKPDVTWVNVYKDPDAETFLATAGGYGALPLVLVGDQMLRRATVGAYLDAKDAAEKAEKDAASDPRADGD